MRATVTTPYNHRIHYKDIGATWKLSTLFLQHIPFHNKNIVFFCIGTDRSTGDALGPLTGSALAEYKSFPFPIIGTLENPLHALNLEHHINETYTNNPEAFVIAIDACLGKGSSIGQFLFQEGPIHPGQAVGKNLPPIGDTSIKAVVNIGGFMEHSVLQSTRLYLSFEMSRILARALHLAYSRSKSEHMKDRHNHTYNNYTWN